MVTSALWRNDALKLRNLHLLYKWRKQRQNLLVVETEAASVIQVEETEAASVMQVEETVEAQHLLVKGTVEECLLYQ